MKPISDRMLRTNVIRWLTIAVTLAIASGCEMQREDATQAAQSQSTSAIPVIEPDPEWAALLSELVDDDGMVRYQLLDDNHRLNALQSVCARWGAAPLVHAPRQPAPASQRSDAMDGCRAARALSERRGSLHVRTARARSRTRPAN